MRIWSIQSEQAWEYLQRHSSLLARRHHRWDGCPHAYDWMREQLIRRIGAPPESDVEPLWGWVQWAGATRKRPDIRALRHHWGPEGNHVMIECELPDQDILLSDHDVWHSALNDWHLSLDEQQGDACNKLRKFYERMTGHKNMGAHVQRRLEQLKRDRQNSWELIFDLEALNSEDWGLMHTKSIQACFWKISMDQVKSCKPFTSRYPKWRQRHFVARTHTI